MPRSRLQRLRDEVTDAFRRDPNIMGDAYGLTSLYPVLAGHEDALEDHLAALPVEAGPLAALTQLHFSRLHVIRDLVYQGPPQKRDPLLSAHLIFTASLDGELDRFLEDLAGLGEAVDAIFSHCAGYPGSGDRAAFARYITEHQVDNGYFLGAYPRATVADVREGLRVADGVADLAARSRTLDDAALQAAFRELMAGGR
jgi:hypothetical protein